MPDRYENESNQEQQEYDREFTYGINWNTNGGIIGGFSTKYAWQLKDNQYRYHYIGLEAVHVTHPKEITVYNTSITPVQGTYITGKIGNFFAIRMQYGREIILFNKAQEEGIQVSFLFGGGPSLGLMVPYYVNYITKTQDIGGGVKSITETKNLPYDTSMSDTYIIEGSGFFSSLFNGGITPYLGVNAKASLNFEFGHFHSSVAGVEVGLMMDAYPKYINIIPKTPNGHNVFWSLFFTLYYGIR